MKSRKRHSHKKDTSYKMIKSKRLKKYHRSKINTRVKRDTRRKRQTRARAKGRGYINECIVPAPRHDETEHESCRAIDLKGDYGEGEDKECNQYYYIYNGKYYRCRDAGKNKCNKTGRSGMRRAMCSPSAQERLAREEDSLEDELQQVVSPNRSLSRQTQSKTALDATIDNLSRQNDKYRERQEQLRERLKSGRSRGNVTRQMENMMARQHKMFDVQIKKNEASIKNLQRLSSITSVKS